MEQELREKMIAKARENGTKHGKTAELDFGAGAEWMYEQLVKNCFIPVVSQQRELLLAYEEHHVQQDKNEPYLSPEKSVDNFIAIFNCG